MADSKYVAWARRNYEGVTLSPLGEKVANIIGLAYQGIYHLPDHSKINWSNSISINVPVRSGTIATFDYGYLSRLVFLAPIFGVRMEVCRSGFSIILRFSEYNHHPTLDTLIARYHAEFDEEIAMIKGGDEG
jgi:hypothetical protein